MKINTNRSKAKKNMKYVGHTSNRPEQILAAKLIQAHLPLWCRVFTEHLVKLHDPDNPDVPYERKLDIAVYNQHSKVAIELNGPPHDETPQIRKDNRKYEILKWKDNDWKVVVFEYTKMPTLFERQFVEGKRNLTYNEAVKAYGEMLTAIGDILPIAEARREIIETLLRKTKMKESDQSS